MDLVVYIKNNILKKLLFCLGANTQLKWALNLHLIGTKKVLIGH